MNLLSLIKGAVIAASLTVLQYTEAAEYRSRNFYIKTKNSADARDFASFSEHYKKNLPEFWGIGSEDWKEPCTLHIDVDEKFEGGAQASFFFVSKETMGEKIFNNSDKIIGKNVYIKGPKRKISYSILPHEINHLILAEYFQKPVPRWADEGCAVCTEAKEEKNRLENILNNHKIPVEKLILYKNYPSDLFLSFYAHGFSLCDYLIKKRGSKLFIEFLRDISDNEDIFLDHYQRYNYSKEHAIMELYNSRLKKYYRLDNTENLEKLWSSSIRDKMQKPVLKSEQLPIVEVKNSRTSKIMEVPPIPQFIVSEVYLTQENIPGSFMPKK